MRQMIIKVPLGMGQEMLSTAEQLGGVNLFQHQARELGKQWDVVIAHLSNDCVGPMIDRVEKVPHAQLTLQPHSIIPMPDPRTEVADKITSVKPRSPIEVWLNGWQSIGSWTGFLGYSVAASVVVWIGMFTNVAYLLVAAMLIAPFAGPAMNTAIATASGSRVLLRKNLLRYFVALLTTALVTYLLSTILSQQTATSMMIDVSQVTSVAVLLPIVAGGAGALALVEAENSSLVSGTAVGLLIAASLAPPAGLIGMAAALRQWDLIHNGVFVLLLQLVAINLSGSIVFRIYGLFPKGAREQQGDPRVFRVSMVVSSLALIALLAWQFGFPPPNLQRSTRAQQALDVVDRYIEQEPAARLVEANLRFTRPDLTATEVLLGVLYVERVPPTIASTEQIQEQIREGVQEALLGEGYNVRPLIDVNVLEPPTGVAP